MNTKGTKFLAVLAVLAMAFAVFAVVTPADADDDPVEVATIATGSKLYETYTYDYNVNKDLKYASGAFTGVMANNANLKYEGETQIFPGAAFSGFGYENITITIPATEGVTAPTYVKITQTNSAFAKIVDGTKIVNSVKTDIYNLSEITTETEDDGMTFDLQVLIPQDGSSIDLQFDYYTTEDKPTSTSTVAATTSFSIDCSEAYTTVELGDDFEGPGYTYATASDGSRILTLTNYSGNAVFYGDIDQVTVTGTNVISADGVSYGIWSTAEKLTIKPVNELGTLSIQINDAPATTYALRVVGELDIQSVNIDIDVSSDVEDDVGEIIAIYTDNSISIYNCTVDIDISAEVLTEGIYAGDAVGTEKYDIDIKSVPSLTIDAQWGIEAGNIEASESTITIVSEEGAIWADTVLIKKNTTLTATASGAADDFVIYGVHADALSAESESVANIDTLYLEAGESVNYATINVSKNVIVSSEARVLNYGTYNVAEYMDIVGQVYNYGAFDVKGVTNISGIDDAENTSIEGFTYSGTETEVSYVTDIEFISVQILPSGDAFVIAEVTLYGLTDPITTYGTAILDGTGKLISIDLELEKVIDDDTYTADLTITFEDEVASEPKKDTDHDARYAADISGTVIINEKEVGFVTSYSTISEDNTGIIASENTTAVLSVLSGTFTTTLLNVGCAQTELVKGGELVAAVVAIKDITVASGKLTGNIATDAAVTIAGSMEGNIVTEANVTISGTLTGDIEQSAAGKEISIVAKATMTGDIAVSKETDIEIAGTLNGNIDIDDNATVIVISGVMDGEISLSGDYKSAAGAKENDASYLAELDIAINGSEATTIKAVASVDSTATKAGSEGYFTIAAGAVAKDKTSEVIVEAGALVTGADIPTAFTIEALDDAVISIEKSKTVLVSGAVVIDDGATLNMKIPKDSSTNAYGTLSYEIKYADSGKTYYCSLTYALSNSPENSTLEVAKTPVDITSDVSIKDGVTVVLAKGVDLTFAGETLAMGDGAEIILGDGSTITFKATTMDEENKNLNSVSGTFEYGGNIVIFTAVVFADESTLTGVAAKSSSDAYLGVDIDFKAGNVDAAAGLIKGTVTFVDTTITEGDKTTYVSGVFQVDATYEGYLVEDEKNKGTVVLNGIFTPAENFEIYNVYSGEGYILLGDNKSVVINALNISETTTTVIAAQNIKVVYGDNVIGLKDLKLKDANKITIESKKATNTVAAKLQIVAGEISSGTIQFDGVIDAQDITLGTKAVGIIDSGTFTILKGADADTYVLDAVGLLKVDSDATFKFNVPSDKTKDYGILKNEVQYTEGTYTVYTYLTTAVKEGGQTSVTTTDDITLDGSTTQIDLGDVAIIVADGKVLNIEGTVTIGTPVKALSGDASITGKVVIKDDAMLIAYSNATVSNVVQDEDKTTAAKSSDVIIDLNGQLYAVVYANANDILITTAEGKMSPSITGYRFAGWSTEVYFSEMTGAYVGDSAILLLLSAKTVTVTLTTVDGAIYYVNNVAVSQTGAPLTLKVGDVVSAAADRSNGYSGTVKVNSESYLTISESTKTVTASGVVAPSADSAKHVIVDNDVKTVDETVKENGFGITEILLVVLVILIAIMVVVVILRLNRS